MNKRNAILGSLAIIAIAAALYISLANFRTVGAGKPAIIVNPETNERIATTWDKILARASEDPPKSLPSPNGGWMTQLPNSQNWGWVINPEDKREKFPILGNIQAAPPEPSPP